MTVEIKPSIKVEIDVKKSENLGYHRLDNTEILNIYVIEEEGEKKKIVCDPYDHPLGFAKLEEGLFDYKITDFDGSSEEYEYAGCCRRIEAINRKGKKTIIDFKKMEAYGEFEDIKNILENLPLGDYNVADL
ncbi:MAG: hypothetical protein ACE5J7_04550 [Candidatus Aenigmatarchaeota archaeon]